MSAEPLPAQLRKTLDTPASANVALSQEAVCVATTSRIRRTLYGLSRIIDSNARRSRRGLAPISHRASR